MITRRLFLFGFLATALSLDLPVDAAKKPAKVKARGKGKKAPPVVATGPRELSRLEWPPSIAPDYIGVGEKGYAVLGDTAGRLVVVDLKQEEAPKVISELGSLGKRVIAMSINAQRAYAIAYQEKNGEGSWALVVISLLPATDPTVIAQMPLSLFAEPTGLAASADTLAICGTGLNGENQVIIYGAGRGKKTAEPVQYGAVTFDRPITALDIQDKNLMVVQADGSETQIEILGLTNPRSPARSKPVRLKGAYSVVAKTRDFFLVGGQNLEKDYEVHAVAFRPSPHVVRGLRLPGVSEILDGVAQKNQILLLVNHKGRQAVLPIAFNPALNLVASNVVLLPAGKRGPASKARIVSTLKEAYVASDWGGVQVLTFQGGGWQYMYSHTIPRLPAAAVALGAERAVLGGADLKVYDVKNPAQPTLMDSADVGSPVKSMLAVGSMMVVLAREGLSMRKLDHPGEVSETVKVTGTGLTFDPVEKRAYVLSVKNDKSSTVNPVRVSALDLKLEKSFEVPTAFRRASAFNGQLMVSSVNDLILFQTKEDGVEPVTSRNFTNLAIRDFVLTGKYALVTAIDQNSRGFLLVLDAEQKELPTVGSTTLSHDGAALAVSGKRVVAIGRTAEGKDQATIISIDSPAAPKIITSIAVVEAASAVAIRENIAVVVGRGLEIISLV